MISSEDLRKDIQELMDVMRRGHKNKARMAKLGKKLQTIESDAKDFMFRQWEKSIRKAEKGLYEQWLREFLSNRPFTVRNIYFYDYSFPEDEFYIVVEDLVVTPLHGASAISIIIPRGIRVVHNDLGHNRLYSMDPCKVRPNEISIPIYSDMVI